MHNLKLLHIVLVVCFIAVGCSSNDSQREFENEAFAFPDGITRTNDRGEIINEEVSPNDWRIAPFFQGLVNLFKPPFPNPVLTTGRVSIKLQVLSIDALSGVHVYVLHDFVSPKPIYNSLNPQIPPGLTVITLNPLDIARFRENPQGIYRLIITDGRDNVITYGDIEIE